MRELCNPQDGLRRTEAPGLRVELVVLEDSRPSRLHSSRATAITDAANADATLPLTLTHSERGLHGPIRRARRLVVRLQAP